MPKTIEVTMRAADGGPFHDILRESLYASDPHFEPRRRASRLLPDGKVELEVGDEPYFLHARLDLPQYGNVWVMADNGGGGFTRGPVDFVRVALETYRREAARLFAASTLAPSATAAAHIEAAAEYEELSDSGVDHDYCALKALSHAIMAAEDALFETSAARLAATGGRPDMLVGCNAFACPGDDRLQRYFRGAFNFATIPFYHDQLAPTEGGALDFARRDELVDWCESVGIAPKGHPLWFANPAVVPAWMNGKSYAELSAFAARTARECAARYRGRMKAWDAINEAHDWANCLGFTQAQLRELTRICCDAVRQGDPDATSIINVCLPFAEYVSGHFIRMGPLPERPLSPLRYLRNAVEDGVDFDAVGIQLYFPARDLYSISRLLDEFAALGKNVHITEMGVPSRPFEHAANPTGATSSEAATVLEARAGRSSRYTDPAMADPMSQVGLTRGVWRMGWNEHSQADWLERFYTIAAARPEIGALSWWDFRDPGFMLTSPFLYDDEVPRAMLFRLKALERKLKIGRFAER